MSTEKSGPGFVLLDSNINVIALNDEAVRILAFPNLPGKIRNIELFLSDRIRLGIVSRQSGNGMEFASEIKSGRRRYLCRSFQFTAKTIENGHTLIGLLLERNSSPTVNLAQAAKQFDFTARESEAVELLIQGLTSKEIANRMQISPNTVKAFLRLIMVKMGVTTRSGVVGRVIGPQS